MHSPPLSHHSLGTVNAMDDDGGEGQPLIGASYKRRSDNGTGKRRSSEQEEDMLESGRYDRCWERIGWREPEPCARDRPR